MKKSEEGDKESPAVGYGHPPAATRFKKGESGNPSGRPKGSQNVATVLIRAARKRVIVKEGDRQRTVSKLDAAATQLANKAALGVPAAAKLFFSLLHALEPQLETALPARKVLDETDRRVVDNFLKRLALQEEGDER